MRFSLAMIASAFLNSAIQTVLARRKLIKTCVPAYEKLRTGMHSALLKSGNTEEPPPDANWTIDPLLT